MLGALGGLLISQSGWVAFVGAAISVAAGVLAIQRQSRSREAAELKAKYTAVRDFLRDFSRLQEAPPMSVMLWNRFLVLAVVFNIAKEVIAQMGVRMPEVLDDPGFATTYWWVSAGSGYDSPVSTLSVGFASAASIAASELSDASGGGGGFSGGGGDGGGGGGGGAD